MDESASFAISLTLKSILQGGYSGMMGPSSSYSQSVSNATGMMSPHGSTSNSSPSGPMGEGGEVLLPADSKQKANSKDEGVPPADPPKPKDGYTSQCASQPPTPLAPVPEPRQPVLLPRGRQ
ncbi:hypothetical protein MHYP_G00132700 [Metynnis hypsauchen]